MLHITNGDCAGDLLKQSRLPGDVVLACDVLHDGPPREIGGDALAAALGRAREHDEVILWFEHDLFDQLHIIRLLAWLADRETTLDRIKMICIGSFPGIAPFHGLGQLSPEQIASLFPSRVPVTEAQLTLGSRAWRAFTSRDPRQVEHLVGGDTSALPFLAGALVRHLEEFPSTRNGLSRTERQALQGMADGATDVGSLFRAVQRMEERVYMGDLTFFEILDGLVSGPVPLISWAGRTFSSPPSGTLSLTAAGRDVLAGRADAIALRGIEKWLGGVHLTGTEARWRWDADRQTLTARTG